MYCLADGAEGIAESESPLGPFTDRGIIKEAHGIDPSALVEKDKVYYFWGQMGLHGAELDLETGKIREETHKTNLLTQDEDGFHEGSSIRKINGKYYMVYADISRGRPTCLGYAISDNPLGPYEKKESSLTITAVTLPPGTTMDLFRKLAKTIMCFITGLRITVYTADASVQRRYRSMKMEPLMKWR